MSKYEGFKPNSQHRPETDGHYRADAPQVEVSPDVLASPVGQAELLTKEAARDLGGQAIRSTQSLESDAQKEKAERQQRIYEYIDTPARGILSADELVAVNKLRKSSIDEIMFSLAQDTDSQPEDIKLGRQLLNVLRSKPNKIPTKDYNEVLFSAGEEAIDEYTAHPDYDLSGVENPDLQRKKHSALLHDLAKGTRRALLLKQDKFGQ